MDPNSGPAPLDAPDLTDLDLTGPAAEYLIDEYQMTLQEAQADLQAQEIGYQISEQVEALFPHEFAGTWVDHGAGGQVTIALASDAVIDSVAAGMPSAGSPIQLIETVYSYDELEAGQGEILTILADYAESVAPLNDTGITLDLINNRVAIEIEDGSADLSRVIDAFDEGTMEGAATAAQIDASVPVEIELVTNDLTIYTGSDELADIPAPEGGGCGIHACTAQVRGGIAIGPRPIPTGELQVRGHICTAAFVARDNNSYYLLTAAHCFTQGRAVVQHHGVDIGRVAFKDGASDGRGGERDYAGIRIANPNLWQPSNILLQPGDPGFQITRSVVRPRAAQIGALICHVGMGLGGGRRSCDEVTEIRFDTPDPDVADNLGIVDDVVACGGDSGGPWYDPLAHRAFGIHSSGENPFMCNDSFHPEVRAAFQWVWDIEVVEGNNFRVLKTPVTWP